MLFRTEVEIPKFPFHIGYSTPTLFCGSCFTENIGGIMRTLKMPVLVNPFGVVYNPISVNNAIKIIIQNKEYGKSDLNHANGLWFSYDHHTKFSSTDADLCLEKINTAVKQAHSFFSSIQNLVVTFGTARIYELKSTEKIVANCHKIPANEFLHYILDVDSIVATWNELMPELITLNPTLKVIFTVSPIRHWKDGAEGNQLSKSTLIVAIHKLIELFPNNAFYFPSYEIMMDDLRDYRFYDDDMLHPSQKAIEYIWGKFVAALIDKPSFELVGKIQKIEQAVNHRPFNPNTKQHQQFIKQTLNTIDSITKVYPNVNFDEEIKMLKEFIVQ